MKNHTSNISLYSEIIELSNHMVRMLTEVAPRIEHWGDVYVLLMHLDGVLARAHHALTHYLPVPMQAHFLQDSSMGPPATKWAVITNMDFALVASSIVQLVSRSAHIYYDAVIFKHRDATRGLKNGELWLDTFKANYVAGQLSADGTTFTRALVPLQPQLAPNSVHFAYVDGMPNAGLDPGPRVQTQSALVDAERTLIVELVASGTSNLAEVALARSKIAEIIRQFSSFDGLLKPNLRL